MCPINILIGKDICGLVTMINLKRRSQFNGITDLEFFVH